MILTASRAHETGDRYEKLFRDPGARRVDVMDSRHAPRLPRNRAAWRASTEAKRHLLLRAATSSWLTTLLGGTPVAKLIRFSQNARGVTVGGTSAGASILSEHMIASATTVRPRSQAALGSRRPGLTNRFIIDQHFRERDRLGRLITALAYNPFAVGIGLDEDTAAFIGPDETLGSGRQRRITVVDASKVSFSSVDKRDRGPADLHPRPRRPPSRPRWRDLQPAHAPDLRVLARVQAKQ